MQHIAVSELKSHLSEYLRKVNQGLTLLITSHNTPVAKLSSVQPAKKTAGLLINNPTITIHWDGKKPKGYKKYKGKPSLKGVSVSQIVLSDRR